MELAKGEHIVRFERDSYRTFEQAITVESSGKIDARLEKEKSRTMSSPQIAGPGAASLPLAVFPFTNLGDAYFAPFSSVFSDGILSELEGNPIWFLFLRLTSRNL